MTTSSVSQRKKQLTAPLQHTCANAVTEDIRHAMIAEAAYYLAEQRGFGGDAESACADWLEAERTVNQLLAQAQQLQNDEHLKKPG